MPETSYSVRRKVRSKCLSSISKDKRLASDWTFPSSRVEMRLASGGALIPKRAHGLKINPIVARNAKVLSTIFNAL
jgi:hypothetical protein